MGLDASVALTQLCGAAALGPATSSRHPCSVVAILSAAASLSEAVASSLVSAVAVFKFASCFEP